MNRKQFDKTERWDASGKDMEDALKDVSFALAEGPKREPRADESRTERAKTPRPQAALNDWLADSATCSPS